MNQEKIKGNNINEVLDSVFLKRKKIGFYHKIDSEQTKILEKIFQENPYPQTILIQKLAESLNESPARIRNWFKSHRKKDFLSTKKIIKTYKKNHCFTSEEKNILENAFRKHGDLNSSLLSELKEKLNNTTETLIKQWFYYRKRKLRILNNEIVPKTNELKRKNKNVKNHFEDKSNEESQENQKNENQSSSNSYRMTEDTTSKDNNTNTNKNDCNLKQNMGISTNQELPLNYQIGMINIPISQFQNNPQFSNNMLFSNVFYNNFCRLNNNLLNNMNNLNLNFSLAQNLLNSNNRFLNLPNNNNKLIYNLQNLQNMNIGSNNSHSFLNNPNLHRFL